MRKRLYIKLDLDEEKVVDYIENKGFNKVFFEDRMSCQIGNREWNTKNIIFSNDDFFILFSKYFLSYKFYYFLSIFTKKTYETGKCFPFYQKYETINQIDFDDFYRIFLIKYLDEKDKLVNDFSLTFRQIIRASQTKIVNTYSFRD